MSAEPKAEVEAQNDLHQHEPDIPRALDDAGRCRVCILFDAKQDELIEMRRQRDAWQQHRVTDDEAQAISACVKALDALTSANQNRGYSSSVMTVGSSTVGRVLDYLAQRYGVTQEPHLQRLIDGLNEALRQRDPQPPMWPPGTANQPLTQSY